MSIIIAFHICIAYQLLIHPSHTMQQTAAQLSLSSFCDGSILTRVEMVLFLVIQYHGYGEATCPHMGTSEYFELIFVRPLQIPNKPGVAIETYFSKGLLKDPYLIFY